jgi:hypothetical protein
MVVFIDAVLPEKTLYPRGTRFDNLALYQVICMFIPNIHRSEEIAVYRGMIANSKAYTLAKSAYFQHLIQACEGEDNPTNELLLSTSHAGYVEGCHLNPIGDSAVASQVYEAITTF